MLRYYVVDGHELVACCICYMLRCDVFGIVCRVYVSLGLYW